MCSATTRCSNDPKLALPSAPPSGSVDEAVLPEPVRHRLLVEREPFELQSDRADLAAHLVRLGLRQVVSGHVDEPVLERLELAGDFGERERKRHAFGVPISVNLQHTPGALEAQAGLAARYEVAFDRPHPDGGDRAEMKLLHAEGCDPADVDGRPCEGRLVA